MPIYFNSAPTDFPFQFDSIGNNWNQEPTLRPDGFPVYHYLQTQKGSGILSIDEKKIPLEKTREYFLPRGYHMFTILLQVSGLLCLPLSVVP